MCKPAGSGHARTLSVDVRDFIRPDSRTCGQVRSRRRRSAGKPQLRPHITNLGQAVCKTVGSAYVGSNPTPATTVMSQDIEDTANPRKGRGVFFGQPDGLPV